MCSWYNPLPCLNRLSYSISNRVFLIQSFALNTGAWNCMFPWYSGLSHCSSDIHIYLNGGTYSPPPYSWQLLRFTAFRQGLTVIPKQIPKCSLCAEPSAQLCILHACVCLHLCIRPTDFLLLPLKCLWNRLKKVNKILTNHSFKYNDKNIQSYNIKYLQYKTGKTEAETASSVMVTCTQGERDPQFPQLSSIHTHPRTDHIYTHNNPFL